MNTKTRTRTPEQKAKDAERARQRRARAKAMATEMAAEDATYAVVVIDGESYQVSNAMTPTEQQNAARLAHEAHLARKNGEADAATPDGVRPAAQDKPKAKRVSKLEVSPRKNGTVRIYPRIHHYATISAAKDWQKQHKAAWSAIKAGKRIEQKNGLVYYSILLASGDDADAVVKLLAQ